MFTINPKSQGVIGKLLLTRVFKKPERTRPDIVCLGHGVDGFCGLLADGKYFTENILGGNPKQIAGIKKYYFNSVIGLYGNLLSN